LKIKPLDIIILLLCISAPLFYQFYMTGNGEKKLFLIIDQKEIELKFEEQTINLEKYGKHMVLQVYKDGAALIESDCPDKICLHMGKITKCGQSAVCVPNKTAITIRCKENEFDAVTR